MAEQGDAPKCLQVAPAPRPQSMYRRALALFAQRTAENVLTEISACFGCELVFWALHEDRLATTLRLGRALLPLGLVGGGAYAAYSLLFKEDEAHGGPEDGGENGARQAGKDGAKEEPQKEHPAPAAEPLPAAVVLAIGLAAQLASSWITNSVMRLDEPTLSEIEQVPLTGRLRRRLPLRGWLEREAEEWGRREMLCVNPSRPGETWVETMVGNGPELLARERLACAGLGAGAALLPADSPASQQAADTLAALLRAASKLIDRRHDTGSPVVARLAEYFRYLGASGMRPGLAVVDFERPSLLGFSYRRRPPPPLQSGLDGGHRLGPITWLAMGSHLEGLGPRRGGGRVTGSTPAAWSELGRWQQEHGEEEMLVVGGFNRGLSIVLSKRTLRGPFGPGILAHELGHLLLRHSEEDAQHLWRELVKGGMFWAVSLCLQPLLRRASAAAVGIDLGGGSYAAGRPRTLRERLWGVACNFAEDSLASVVFDLKIMAMAAFAATGIPLPQVPLFEAADQGSSTALKLVHELEAEQCALLLTASLGHMPNAYLLRRQGALEFIREQGGGDLQEGINQIARQPASSLTISRQDLRMQWPDVPKVVWALVQVFSEALEEYEEQAAQAALQAAQAAIQAAQED